MQTITLADLANVVGGRNMEQGPPAPQPPAASRERGNGNADTPRGYPHGWIERAVGRWVGGAMKAMK
jgi:hypothetical protein